MTTLAEYEPILSGSDPVSSGIIAFFTDRGWRGDYILKNIATKHYPPHHATVRVHLDADNRQYYLKGEYFSQGVNVLALCSAFIKESSTADEVSAILCDFLADAEQYINTSFAVRFLGSL